MVRLFHIATRDDWEDALAQGSYRMSTLGMSLEEVGFIHLSYAHQLHGVADRFYAGRDDLVLLEFDSAALQAPIMLERVAGEPHRFPHLYGPFSPAEVIRARPFRPGADGAFPALD